MILHTLAVLCALSPSLAGAQTLWTRPLPVYDLDGADDIVAAATAGGVVLWNITSGRSQIGTIAHGLPSHVVLGASLFPDRDALCVATTNGLARGWFQSHWTSVGARNDERGLATYSILNLAGGRSFAGGEAGLLLRWDGTRLDSLRIPTPRGRVVSLAWFASWLDGRSPRTHPAAVQHDGAPLFPVGLAAAVDNDGLWLLRDSGSLVRWLRFVQEDGLPSHRTKQVLTDSQGRLWVATDRGIAWIDANLNVHSLTQDPLGAQRTHVLLEGGDDHLYAGTDAGLVRIDLADPEAAIEPMENIPGPVVAMARTHDALWVSDGWSVVSLDGARLEPPHALQDNFSLSLLEHRGSSWVGHLAGRISLGNAAGWSHLGPENGLPAADITHFFPVGEELFVGTNASGLYVTRNVTLPRFSAVPGTPASIATQMQARGLHWVGGQEGLFVQRGSLWQSFPLWPGATHVVDLCSAGDTLWASAAEAGVAFHDGLRWITPTRPPGFGFAHCGGLDRHGDGRVAVATDRGLLLWDGRELRCDPQSPDLFLTDVAWWGSCLACGSHRGLWIRHATGRWDTLGVLDGLPGAQVRALDVDGSGGLWVASTRGVGRVDPRFCAEADESAWRRNAAVAARTWTLVPFGSAQPERIEIFDVRGRLVQRLDGANEPRWAAGSGSGKKLPAGVYFIRTPRGVSTGAKRIVVFR